MTSRFLLLFALFALTASTELASQKLPPKKDILATVRLTNQYFMNKWPDPGKTIVTNRERPSNILDARSVL